MLSKFHCFTWVSTLYQADYSTKLELPLYTTFVSAGFPLPGDDHIEQRLNLNDLIEHPAATFFARVAGDSMIQAGIHHGDIIVVDRSLEPSDGTVVVAAVNGEMLIKRVNRTGERLFLLAENPDYLPLEITDEMDFSVWGVVTNVIHRL